MNFVSRSLVILLSFGPLFFSSLETLSHAVGNPTHQVKGSLGGSVLFPANVSQGITVQKMEWDFHPQRGDLGFWLTEFSHGKLEHPSPTDQFGQRLDMVDKTTLRIKDLELDDGGIYNARIWFTKAQFQEQSFSLTVYEPVPTPQIHHQVESKTPGGCNATLRCHTPGREDLSVSWETGKLHEALEKSVNQYQVSDNGRELRVSFWNGSFNSKFTCLVSNPVDQKGASFDLLNICQSDEGTTFALLQSAGTSPVLQEFSKMTASGSEITSASSFNTLGCSSSGPGDLNTSKLANELWGCDVQHFLCLGIKAEACCCTTVGKSTLQQQQQPHLRRLYSCPEIFMNFVSRSLLILLSFGLLIFSSLETVSHAVGNPTHQVKGILGGTVLFPANVSQGITVEKMEWGFYPQGGGRGYWLGEFNHGKLEHPSATDQFGQRLDMVNKTTLRIKDLEFDDGGIYNTRIWFTKTLFQEQHFSLTVYEPVPTPQIDHQVESKTPGGCNATLRCHTPGREDLSVSWETRNLHMALGKSVNQYQVSDNGRELRVFYWNSYFNSKFTCLVSNPIDQKRASFDLLNICQSDEGGQFGPSNWIPLLIPSLIVFLVIMVMMELKCWKIRFKRNRRD